MSRAEQLIYQRRAQEQKLSNMQTKLKQEFHQQEFAKWQNKGKNLEIQNQLKARLNQARVQSQANLNYRRYHFMYVDKNWQHYLNNRMKPIKEKLSKANKLLNKYNKKWLKESKSLKLKKRLKGKMR